MNKKILKSIQQIDSALIVLNRELGFSDNLKSKEIVFKRVSKGSRKQGSTKPIQSLLDIGFFKSPKTDLEVIGALKKKAFKFERKDIAITLMRFVRKEILEREGNGAKGNPWRYKKS